MNYGLNIERELEEQHEKDWVFGAASQECIALIPEKERSKYLPKGEVQKGREDFMDCATRGPINILESKFDYLYTNNLISPENKKWLEEKGYVQNGKVTFSDRFIAMKSKTTKEGNSLKAPLQAIHSYGLIPKKMLPAHFLMTWDQYHDKSKITIDMEVLGAQFLNRFPVNYERVFLEQFDEVIKHDIIDVAGYAWPFSVNGEYPRVSSPPNHCFIYFATPRYNIFDNYLDTDKDYVKKLADDYGLMDYGYRLFVAEQEVLVDRTWLDIIIALLTKGKPLEALQLINKQLGSWIGFGNF